MRKKIFVFLSLIMLVSIVGIILIQTFWINNAIEISKNQFSSNAKSALKDVATNIEKREFRDFIEENRDFFSHTQQNPKNRDLRTYIFQKIDTINNEIFTYKQSTLIDNYEVPKDSKTNTSIKNFKSYFSKKEKEISSLDVNIKKDLRGKQNYKATTYSELPAFSKLEMEQVYKEVAPSKPIYQRISKKELKDNLQKELKSRGIDTPFEYAVFAGEFPTKLRSKNFNDNKKDVLITPIFYNDLGKTKYYLKVYFPDKKGYIFSNIKKPLFMAVTFIILIILVFIFALYQMIKQKKISEIKTDFINNMTHEFKTPIATINLALDAIKNPKIITNKEQVLKYVNMIRDENKRMHEQVENVLRISKLEKNQLEISKEVVDIHDILNNAISHVELIIKNKGGYIKKHYNAILTEVLGNNLHLTNVFVNILDNAIKYSKEAPKIDVFTQNHGNAIIVKIKDQGMGMTKAVQKQVFDKFYREQKGNIHDVKGHGLGLSYVKKIIENHNGTVSVESEKDKGSTFIIKLPTI
ncbi:MAG TPA: HAMP domain-containing histidine kinase [Flavobacteriia bacterium]|nr:HAMP domain-containing histidine kinase [Flavobacteriia bacterium]